MKVITHFTPFCIYLSTFIFKDWNKTSTCSETNTTNRLHNRQIADRNTLILLMSNNITFDSYNGKAAVIHRCPIILSLTKLEIKLSRPAEPDHIRCKKGYRLYIKIRTDYMSIWDLWVSHTHKYLSLNVMSVFVFIRSFRLVLHTWLDFTSTDSAN